MLLPDRKLLYRLPGRPGTHSRVLRLKAFAAIPGIIISQLLFIVSEGILLIKGSISFKSVTHVTSSINAGKSIKVIKESC